MQFKVMWTGGPPAKDVRGVLALGAGFGMDDGKEQRLRAWSESGKSALTFETLNDPECLEHALDRVRRIQDDLLRLYGVESTYEVDGKQLSAYLIDVFGKLCSVRITIRQVVNDLRRTRGVPMLRDKRIAAARIQLERAL